MSGHSVNGGTITKAKKLTPFSPKNDSQFLQFLKRRITVELLKVNFCRYSQNFFQMSCNPPKNNVTKFLQTFQGYDCLLI